MLFDFFFILFVGTAAITTMALVPTYAYTRDMGEALDIAAMVGVTIGMLIFMTAPLWVTSIGEAAQDHAIAEAMVSLEEYCGEGNAFAGFTDDGSIMGGCMSN